MVRNNFIIAIDGFSSCGKSTLAKALAKELNFVFVDSGAMYRAVTLYFLRNSIDISNRDAVNKALKEIKIDLIPLSNSIQIMLNSEDVSTEIRQMEVSSQVSVLTAQPLNWQHSFPDCVCCGCYKRNNFICLFSVYIVHARCVFCDIKDSQYFVVFAQCNHGRNKIFEFEIIVLRKVISP